MHIQVIFLKCLNRQKMKILLKKYYSIILNYRISFDKKCTYSVFSTYISITVTSVYILNNFDLTHTGSIILILALSLWVIGILWSYPKPLIVCTTIFCFGNFAVIIRWAVISTFLNRIWVILPRCLMLTVWRNQALSLTWAFLKV